MCKPARLLGRTKLLPFLGFLAFLVFLTLDIEASSLGFRFYGGGSWVDGGDLNKNIQGWKDYFIDRNEGSYSSAYDVKKLHRLWDSGAEAAYGLSPRLRITLGIEFLTGKTKGEIFSVSHQEQDYFNSNDDFGETLVDEQSLQQPQYRLQAVHIPLTFSYSFPFGNRAQIFLGGGVGYYSGELKFNEIYQYDFDYIEEKNLSGTLIKVADLYSSLGEYSEETTCKTFGFHLKGSLELEIRRDLFLIIEAVGRWVEFRNWQGSKTDTFSWDHIWGPWGAFSESDSQVERNLGRLWFAETQSDEMGKSYPQFVFSEEEPQSSIYNNARPAKINLNGISLRIGIRISL